MAAVREVAAHQDHMLLDVRNFVVEQLDALPPAPLKKGRLVQVEDKLWLGKSPSEWIEVTPHWHVTDW